MWILRSDQHDIATSSEEFCALLLLLEPGKLCASITERFTIIALPQFICNIFFIPRAMIVYCSSLCIYSWIMCIHNFVAFSPTSPGQQILDSTKIVQGMKPRAIVVPSKIWFSGIIHMYISLKILSDDDQENGQS